MRSLRSLLSRLSWVFLNLGCYGTHYVVFRPSWQNFLIFCVVEAASLWVTIQIDKKLFPKIYPETRSFFPNFELESYANLDHQQREKMVRSLMHFPLLRATYCWFIGYAKVIPTNAMVVVFLWDHERSNVAQFFLFMAIETIWYAYMYAVQYIELHQLVSQQLGKLHDRFNWSELFTTMSLEKLKGSFELQEGLASAAIWISLVALQSLLIYHFISRPLYAIFLIAVTSTVAFILMARIWYVSHQYFLNGLGALFSALELYEPSSRSQAVPLWSTYQLARLQRIFNQMISRLNGYDAELSQWITTRAEQSRYEALGELSSLVVHDISGPLHVIDFCTKQLEENPERISDPQYLSQLSLSSGRALELVQSLRAHISSEADPKEVGTRFSEAATHVVRLLEIQFSVKALSQIKIQIAPELAETNVKMRSADVVHVLLNVLQNSTRNLLDNKVPNPQINLNITQGRADQICFYVEDNGTGLSAERFEELTAFLHKPKMLGSGREGLGLRLIRRLVERSGGEVSVLDKANQSGTQIKICLPRAERSTHELS